LNTTQTIIENAKQSILSQSESIAKLTQYLTEDFAKTVQLIFDSKGRLGVTGIGKSAIIAQKIVATLNSTGTPSILVILVFKIVISVSKKSVKIFVICHN
jgi:arabinose-5-phosphate isomerase